MSPVAEIAELELDLAASKSEERKIGEALKRERSPSTNADPGFLYAQSCIELIRI